ncbi:uncharacterized protein LOC108937305 isoform X1 [Arapaima gigas]
MDVHLTNWMFYLFFFSSWINGVRGQKRILQLQIGENFTIECTLQGRTVDGVYLFRRLSAQTMVLFWNSTSNKPTVNTRLQHKVKMENNFTNFRFKMTDVEENDSGVYWCSTAPKGDRDSSFAVLVTVSGRCPCTLLSGPGHDSLCR